MSLYKKDNFKYKRGKNKFCFLIMILFIVL